MQRRGLPRGQSPQGHGRIAENLSSILPLYFSLHPHFFFRLSVLINSFFSFLAVPPSLSLSLSLHPHDSLVRLVLIDSIFSFSLSVVSPTRLPSLIGPNRLTAIEEALCCKSANFRVLSGGFDVVFRGRSRGVSPKKELHEHLPFHLKFPKTRGKKIRGKRTSGRSWSWSIEHCATRACGPQNPRPKTTMSKCP